MKKTIQIAGQVIMVLILLDMLGFAAWVISGQHPVDDFYVGTITAHALRLVIK